MRSYFFEILGKLPNWHEVTWRKDSCLNDGIKFGSDLSGGFFDAGDYMKFTFPLSFTMNVLSWSLEGIYLLQTGPLPNHRIVNGTNRTLIVQIHDPFTRLSTRLASEKQIVMKKQKIFWTGEWII